MLRQTLYWLVPCLLYLYAIHLVPNTAGKDLIPTPDAEEYALLALRLAHFQPPLIGVGLYDYASRYSLAYPLLLAPVAAALRFDATRFYLAAAFFGLVAVVLLARTGRWLTGSRLAGALAASFFALHPQTVRAASFTMSESGMLMMFLIMLELARPWLDRARAEAGPGRAALLGLVLGWLTLAKAPYAYWAIALTVLVAARAVDRRRFAPLVALVLSGGIVALADLFYRRWAFGAWGGNGYRYWAPSLYDEFLKTFNIAYLHEPFSALDHTGNLAFYGRMLLGRADDFYGRFMAPVAAVAAVMLAWPGRRGRPWPCVIVVMAGWAGVGALFCGFYFYQEARFPHLWIPLVDLLAAWGLVHGPRWSRLRHGWPGRLRAWRWAQVATLMVALLLLRGEYRRVLTILGQSPEFQRPSYAEMIRPLLKDLPPGAWLFTNFKPVTVELCRPTPGPTGSLYIDMLDGIFPLLNLHVYAIDLLGLKPHGGRADMARELQNIPQAWEDKPAELIGMAGTWTLSPSERRAFFSRPAYALIVRPFSQPGTVAYLNERIVPLLHQGLRFEKLGFRGEATLYRMENAPE